MEIAAISPAHFLVKLCLVLSFISLSCFLSVDAEGCTAPLILPDKPFFVVWNHPSSRCESHGVHLGFEDWGIVDNSKDQFIGEQISIFYRLGKWPYYSGTTAVNGGIPQLADQAAHFSKVESDIDTLVPNKAFSGLGVIDFEHWRPLYGLNYDTLRIYQRKSLDLAKQRFPLLNTSQLVAEATKEFEEAARSMVGKTLIKATELRPSGRWGYYGYPRCWDKMCNTSTITINDKMMWIFNTSTGLYPSIYFDLSVPPETRGTIIKKKIHETLRVKAKFSPQDATIFPYALNQNGPYNFFTEDDLLYSIEQPANMGASGVVLWGSSGSMSAKNECLLLQDYISGTLGPFVRNLTNFFGNCSQQLCNGHGRCVRKDYERIFQYHLRASGRTKCLINEETLRSDQSVERRRQSLQETSEGNNDRGKQNGRNHNFTSNSLKFVRRRPTSVGIWTWWDAGKDGSQLEQRSNVPMLSFQGNVMKSRGMLQNKGITTVDKIFRANKRDRSKPRTMMGTGDADFYTSALQGVRKNDVFDADSVMPADSSKQKYEKTKREATLDDPSASYDFHSYVCKCFEGWSGDHCDQK